LHCPCRCEQQLYGDYFCGAYFGNVPSADRHGVALESLVSVEQQTLANGMPDGQKSATSDARDRQLCGSLRWQYGGIFATILT